jgi:hypothetical protein
MDVNVTEQIEAARRELAAGNKTNAARILTEAAYHTHDADVERTIRDLALEGRSKAGFFGKGRWDEIIRIAELRGGKRQG